MPRHDLDQNDHTKFELRKDNSDVPQASSTYMVETAVPIGDSTRTIGVAKTAVPFDPNGINESKNVAFDFLRLEKQGKDLEIILTQKPNLLARAVASSDVNKALDIDIQAEEVFSKISGDEIVSVSSFVKGRALVENIIDDDDGKSKQRYNFVDFTNPNTQRGLHDLQAFDYLIQQVDRHGGNIFIDDEGFVKGIDNDLCLSEGRPKYSDNASREDPLPPYLHEETAIKFMALTPKRLQTVLENVRYGEGDDLQEIKPGQIQAAQQRLQTLQDHIRQLERDGKLVGPGQAIKEFDLHTYNAVMMREIGPERNPIDQPMESADKYLATTYLGRSANFYQNAHKLYGSIKETPDEKLVNKSSHDPNLVEKVAELMAEEIEFEKQQIRQQAMQDYWGEHGKRLPSIEERVQVEKRVEETIKSEGAAIYEEAMQEYASVIGRKPDMKEFSAVGEKAQLKEEQRRQQLMQEYWSENKSIPSIEKRAELERAGSWQIEQKVQEIRKDYQAILGTASGLQSELAGMKAAAHVEARAQLEAEFFESQKKDNLSKGQKNRGNINETKLFEQQPSAQQPGAQQSNAMEQLTEKRDAFVLNNIEKRAESLLQGKVAQNKEFTSVTRAIENLLAKKNVDLQDRINQAEIKQRDNLKAMHGVESAHQFGLGVNVAVRAGRGRRDQHRQQKLDTLSTLEDRRNALAGKKAEAPKPTFTPTKASNKATATRDILGAGRNRIKDDGSQVGQQADGQKSTGKSNNKTNDTGRV